MLSNVALKYYDSEVLRLQRETRTQYHAQVDRLIAKLSSSVKDKTKIKITRVVKAGSFAKFTILRKSVDDPVDVDVVFYISGRSLESSSFESLSSDIYDLLVELYPTKAVEDFEIQKRAATVVFKGSGLAVDIVPVIEIGSAGYGYQFDTQGGKTKTCAPCQISFVQTRKNTDDNYRTLVRLGKKWRNYQDIPGLKSFHVELILAYLQDTRGPSEKIEQRLRDFFLFIDVYKRQGHVDIATHLVYELDADGNQLQVVRFTDYTRDKVRTLYPSADDLRGRWSDPEQRKLILNQLEELGINFDELA